MADILGIGYSALAAAQRQLSTTSHNISNANTDGYSRQTVNLATNPPELYGTSYLGSGVNIASINRVYDQFLVNQLRVNTSSFSSVDTFQQLASTIDNLLGDSTTSLSTGIENFFSAVHQVADNPTSVAVRQNLLGSADSLVSNFQYLNNAINQGYSQINTELSNSVTQINSIAKNIADLNKKIVLATGTASGGAPNDLLDQRDAALAKLANLVSVSTVTESNGAVDVFIGNGQSLVVGSESQQLSIVQNLYDATRNEIGYVSSGGGSVNISNQISGGSLGGLLNYRNQVLDPTKNALGRLAIGMADNINMQNHLGMDLNGAPGGDIFTVASPLVAASSSNSGTGSVSASLVSVNGLTTSDYKLVYNGGNNYELTRLSDGQTFPIDTGGTYPFTTSVMDGISLTINSGAAVGDSFLISPTQAGVDQLNTVISDPTKIAAAVPVAVTTSLGNMGAATAGSISVNNPNDKVIIQFTSPSTYNVLDKSTGAMLAQGVSYTSGGNISFNGWTTSISDGGSPPASGDIFYIDQGVTSADNANTGGAVIDQAVMSIPDPNLTDAVTITFTSPNTFTVSGATTGSPTVNVPYTSGGLISFNGWNFSISGTPATGDSFTVGPNTNGVGDNGNALKMAMLQNNSTLSGGTASFQDAYRQIVADIGTKTQEASTSHDALKTILQQSTDARDAVSGVNLDEEAANMLRFQQAYQAAAKVISTSNTLFQSILSAVNG